VTWQKSSRKPWRNEFHVGLQQAFGRYLIFSGEYVWKYTHNAYDFGVLGSTPLTFPIEWHNSKIPAFAGRVSVPNNHGFTALFVFSSVVSRFFTPQLGGAGQLLWRLVPSASIMTRSLTRPRICSTSRGKRVRGSTSTGGIAAIWSLVRFRSQPTPLLRLT
jgi:hypothetical protein